MLRIIVLCFIGLTATSQVRAVDSYGITEQEMLLLPDYCQAKYGKYRGNKAVSDRWSRVFGPENWHNMHHYCHHLKEILRADRSIGNTSERLFHLQKARQGLERLLENETTDDWVLRPEAHTKLAKVLLDMARLRKNAGYESEAVNHLKEAIQIKPDYVPPYLRLADYYADHGEPEQALEVVREGLNHVSDSSALERRNKELSAK